MDDPAPIAVTVETCPDHHERYRWHLTDDDGISVRASPESCASPEVAGSAGAAALRVFGAPQLG